MEARGGSIESASKTLLIRPHMFLGCTAPSGDMSTVVPHKFVQSYPSYSNTFVQRGFIGCSDKRNCSDNPNEIFLVIYIPQGVPRYNESGYN